jgi:hypothetical protein
MKKTRNLMTISIYRDHKFITRSIGIHPRVARADLAELEAGKVPWPKGRYEARLLSRGRVIKVIRWRS